MSLLKEFNEQIKPLVDELAAMLPSNLQDDMYDVLPTTQKERILKALEQAGAIGVTGRQLNRICFRYSARILDLRRDGYDIESHHVKGSLWLYRLANSDSHILMG